MLSISIVFFAYILAVLPGMSGQTKVQSLDPKYGSTAGGTRLAISGSGFGDMYTDMSVVFVGPYPCKVISHLSSSEVLTCETSPGLAGTYFVTISVGGDETQSIWGYTYADSYTPTLKAVTPHAGPPGTATFLYGDATWNLQYVDCLEKTWGDKDCVGSITFGDYLCRQDPSIHDTEIAFTTGYTNQRYGYNLYRVGCTLPAPDAGDAQPSLGTAGNVNATIHFEASLRGGTPLSLRSSYMYDVDGRPYHFQLHPEVSGVAPSRGSNAGGTLLRVTGRGFPTLSLGLRDTINISVSGVPCTIVNSTYDTVFCNTGPKPKTPPLSEVPVGGLYPAMRGVEYEFYNTSDTMSYEDLWRLNNSIKLDSTNGTGSYKTVLTGTMEGLDFAVPYYCSRMKAFFTAPRTGDYRFYMQADDVGQVNGTWLQGNGVQVTRMLINHTDWTPADEWFKYDSQKSEPVPLSAGQRILLESVHSNGPSIGFQQVAVRMSVPKPQANSMAEIQSVAVTSVLVPQSLAIKYMYGAGASTTAYTVTIVAAIDAKLDNPALGLELTFSARTPVVVVVPVTATGAHMTALIETGFGGLSSLGSNSSTFGVLKLRSVGTVTVQVGINATQGDSLGFDITLARLVTIPSSVSFTPPECDNDGVTYPQPSPVPSLPLVPGDAASGLIVVLSPAWPVPAVTPGGYFQLRLPGSAAPLQLAYDTNATVMGAAIKNLTGYDTTVSLVSRRREGTHFARVWNVTFPLSILNKVPNLVVDATDITPEGVLLTTEVRPANPPVTGSFRLSFGSNCGSVSIDVADPSETVRLKLASLPGMTAPQSVVISGGPAYGYTYLVTFDPIGNPGDQPSLRVVDVAGLNGVSPNVTVTTSRDGSTDAFYAPISAEFLQLAVAEPGTIAVSVNGVPSSCTHPSGLCAFQYSDAATPHITSISPTRMSFSSQSSLPLTITGTGFDGGRNVEVKVGGTVCNLTSATATQIVCSAPDTAPAGLRLVTVNVEGLGFAMGAANITLETLYITGSSPAPAVVAAVGVTVLNFTGKGFDAVTCGNNKLAVGSVDCGVVACGKDYLTAIYPGGISADVPAARIKAQVFEADLLIDEDTPSSLAVQVSVSAPAVTAVSPDSMPGAGGVVSVTLAEVAASSVVAAFMVPYMASMTDYKTTSVAFKGRVQCEGVAPSLDGSGVSCTSPGLPNGRYHVLVVLSSGLQLLSTNTITFDMAITSVSPNLGSIGGGTTITITGSGFSPELSRNAVFLAVPVSSTFLNGVVECVAVAVTATQLKCVTLPNLAADADADDPGAKKVMPIATAARPITVVVCDPSYDTTILRGYCWSLPSSPRARCAATGAASCDFGYTASLTPAIEAVLPNRGFGWRSVTVAGQYMTDVTVVQFLQGDIVKGVGTNIVAWYGAVTCTLPDLPPGVYRLRLVKAAGEMSVDPYSAGVFTFYATILGLSYNAGSLAGGLPLTIQAGGAGVVVGDSNATANVVTIAGLPCPILSVDDRTRLTCRAPGINGYVYAEYWNLAINTYSMPDLISYTDPVVARLERGINFAWNASSPLPGTIQLDFWAARFTFYYQIAQTESVAFRVDSDDDSRFYVDDKLLGGRSTYLNVTLTPGIHKMVVLFVEYTGWAALKLRLAPILPDGSLGSLTSVEWQKVTPIAPGTPLTVNLAVNGVSSEPLCAPSTVVLQLPGQPALPFEPSELTTDNNTCAYVYSTHRTPSLVSLKPIAMSGITLPTFNGPSTTMSIYGNFLTDLSTPAASQISVTLGNRSCAIVDVSPFAYNTSVSSNVSTTVNGSTVYVTVINTTIMDTTRISCIAPAVSVGLWAVSIMVAGNGLTRPTASASTDLPFMTYTLRVNDYNSPTTASASKCYFSMFGGGTFNISGYGFVKDLVDPTLQRNMTAAWEAYSPCSPTSVPTCQAAISSRMTIVPVACDGPTARFRLTRFTVPNPEAYAGNNSLNINVRYKPRAYYTYPNTPQYDTTASSELLYFCGGRTPVLSGIAPATVAPDAGSTGEATLSLTWFLSGVGSNNDTVRATNLGAASNATVEFETGPNALVCMNPTVAASSITATTYTETIRCTLPTYLPASSYTLWLCIQPFGCGLQPTYIVPLTVTAISAIRGSSAGGIVVTITGKGFDTNATRVAARFGDSVCKITNSTSTSLVCLTGPLDAKPASAVTSALSVTSTIGASEIMFNSFTFTLDPALEGTVSSITPNRGSTEGGTAVTITGADFATGASTTVLIGETACTSVAVVSSTTITCTTGKPPSSVLRVPLPVTVMQAGRGFARSSVAYQYIDLWSRNSTWGGGPLPGFEDSVVIPPGVTVLLDMSPPKLYALVLQGNLVFDDTLPYINLQAHYILVKGGNFSIGTVEKPFPGRANITMHGAPNSLDLPMYGAKALGVREGIVTFHGLPKVPIYTKLNESADINATTITVGGPINWEVGDRIVIASSSFYPNENDEATITALDNVTVPGCTIITLDTPLKYTHLGEIHSQAGVATPLDMRAEVAVLTRNVLLTGDYTSAKNMYGVQVMVNTPSFLPKALVRFDNIEITQSGQAFRLGRYSMHWHLMGDVAFQTWVRGCSIHHTYNRAITIHGTHRAIIQNTLAYNTMGHTFFLEDGVETSNLIEGNIGIYTKVSDALLNTDTTPATFWLTNPNNTVRNNVAVGSHGYGYWYRMLDHPEGPSFSVTVCPKFTPLLEFTNNSAHSNMFYGLRIHPEFYPRNIPCNGFSYGTFEQVPAVFNGMVAYKNGMKGAVASQVGLVQFVNMVMGDNGGGPRQHLVSGKDHGGSMEMTWVVDDRDRYDVQLTEMAGFINATIYARTTTGMRGSAGQWPSGRRVTGIIAQSPVLGDAKHSALMSMINMTFVDFTDRGDHAGFTALEHCGKCKNYQGGATTFTAGISFVNQDRSRPAMSLWSWGHQGIFLDTDGSLINANTVPTAMQPSADAGWTFGPGTTWHSAVESELFNPAECVYVRSSTMSNNGAYCSPALTFRRVMLNNHGPPAMKFKDLKVVALATNRTSNVHFSHYNEDGYQFTTPISRDYWLHWDMSQRLDPDTYTLHKMELMNASDFVYFTSKYIQHKNHFKVNNRKSNRTEVPPPLVNTTHGDFFYNQTFAPNNWWWSNRTYNDTKFTVFTAGRVDSILNVAAFTCPDEGCGELPDTVVDIRNGTLYWSDFATWNTSSMNFAKPGPGDNVTIPFGWDLVIDESPSPLLLLVIQGSVRFDPTKDVNLTATYILVMGQGSLRAGSPEVPHPTAATIFLSGRRDTPDFGLDNTLNLGSKVLAAVRGGSIDLYGRQVGKRWIRLDRPAAPSEMDIYVSDPSHGWRKGDKIIITSTTFNVGQSEIRTITAVSPGGTQLTLDAQLNQPHGALIKSYPGGPTVDMRAEVGLLSSNVLITATDGDSTHSYNGELFGARVVVSGNSTGRFSCITMEYCGQAGLLDRACMFFDRLTFVRTVDSNTGSEIVLPNPSLLHRSALVWGMNGNVRVDGVVGEANPVKMVENVMYESFDAHSIEVYTTNNYIKGNLVVGTIKDMTGKSGFDLAMPSSYYLAHPNNWVQDNVAAGSERYGYSYFGTPCGSNYTDGYFRNNTAHSCLAGLWLQSSEESQLEGCTALRNFTTYMNWDFGIISTRGITTDVVLEHVNILDTKHSGITILRKGGLTDKASVWWYGGLLAGQSSPQVCAACSTLYDIGCHKKLSRQSYNMLEPFTPAVGLQSAQFAMAYTDGPERKPWDRPKSYAMVHGMFNITGVTLADFLGTAGCGGATVGTYALANHPDAPETFFPHFFSGMNVVNVATGPAQGMFMHTPPNPLWRNEADCGEAVYTRADGTTIPLNCAGPAHVYWRDLDGSLSGGVTIAGMFPSGPRVFPMDQGTPVIPGPCTYSSVYDSYSCLADSTSFLLDTRLKPDPIPSDGIWGDPQYFVLESRDKDSEDRNFGPVFFNVSGSIDLVTTQMDHGCCFTYMCQKRLSTFATYIPSGQTVYINFTGSPAQVFRLWYPYADPDKEVVLVINYLYTLSRRFVLLPYGVGPVSGRLTPEAQPVQIGDGTGHGAYYWDQFHTLMYVKMKGGKMLEIRTENAVQISQSFALTVDQFYDIQPLFLKNLAYAMNISNDRMFIVRVVPGSATVTMAIAPEPVDVPELTIADGVDAGDPLPPAPPPDPPVVFTDDDLARLAAMGSNAPALDSITSTKLLLLRQLWTLFDVYKSVIDTAASATGFKTAGPPSQYIPNLGDPEFPPTETTATSPPPATSQPTTDPSQPATSPTTAPGSDPVVLPPDVTGNANSGNGYTNDNGDAKEATAATHEDDKGSSIPMGAVIGGVVGGCVIAGVAAIAIFAVRRRRVKRTRPASPPSEPEALDYASPGSPMRGSIACQSDSVREAFVTTGPTKVVSQRVSEEGDPPVLGSPRYGGHASTPSNLAAGYISPTEPEVIRPLVSTSKQPHSSLPLTLSAAPLGPMVAGPSRRAQASSMTGSHTTKSPAQLLRHDSLSRNSAPHDWGNDGDSVECTALRGRLSQSVTGGGAYGSHPGSARHVGIDLPVPRVGLEMAPESPVAADAHANEEEQTVADAGGETPIVPVHRTLETMESFIPRPKSRAASVSRPSSVDAAHAAGAVNLAADGEEGAAPEETASPMQQQARAAASLQPTMMLPGGMMEFSASPSLLRSEVAALVVAGGASNNEGFGGSAAAVMEEEQQQANMPVARTPAGLHSDSMRRREQ